MSHPVIAPSHRLRDTLRAVAVYEALKGVAALAGLLGLLSLLHHDVHRLALELIGHLHLDPARPLPELALHTVDQINATPVHTLVLVGLVYTALRWTEAWGLWHDKAWGEWVGVIGTAAYVPFEVMHLMHKPTWQSTLVLSLNLALVAVLLFRLWQRHQQARATESSSETTRPKYS